MLVEDDRQCICFAAQRPTIRQQTRQLQLNKTKTKSLVQQYSI